MRFKRILAGAFALALTLPLLIPWAQAHPGRTDANGGHKDTDTGDYHYHHGYEAHAHFDIDGNGAIDCPFDFVNKTGQNSGARSTGTSTPGDGSEDGYQEGYVDGYWEGKSEGEEEGYTKGYDKGSSETEREFQSQILQLEDDLTVWRTYSFWICGILLTSLILVTRHSSKKRKRMEANYQYQSDAKQSEYTTQTNINNAMHEAQIQRLKKEYQDRIDGIVTDHKRRYSRMVADHAAEVRYLKRRLINFRRLDVIENFISGRDKSIDIPEDVHFRPSYIPIRGKTTKRYPYGSYTVFMVLAGKTYHCKHDCVPQVRPLHFFDIPVGTAPCSRCVSRDMRPQPRPEWYTKLQEKLESIVSDAEEENVYYIEAANGMTIRVPESKLESDASQQKRQLTPEERERIKQQLKERILGGDDVFDDSDIRFSLDST